jgi:N-acetylglucosamine-6-sulfatase
MAGIRLIGAVAALTVIVVLGAGGETPASGAAAAPNVVVVLLDDARSEDIHVMDSTRRLVFQRGTSFARYFSTFPLCCPFRSTLLTGQYAHNHGVMSNKPPLGGYPAFDDDASLAVALQGGGYRTSWTGKYMNGYGKGPRGRRVVPPGWDGWASPVRGAHKLYGYALNVNGRLRRYPRTPANYRTDVEARLAARQIRRGARGRRPFFSVLSLLAPHGEPRGMAIPRNPRPAPRDRRAFTRRALPTPPSFNERNMADKPAFKRPNSIDAERRAFLRRRHRDRLASLLAADDAVARVIRALRKTGELENTYVIFTSDNGFLMGEHRDVGKVALYEESARVPLAIRGPGFPAGQARTQITGSIDLAPTILDVAGVNPLLTPDGVSLLPFAADPAYAADRDILLENRDAQGLRTTRYVYIEHERDRDPTPEAYELYDLQADPYQLENLIGPATTEPRTHDRQSAADIERLREDLAGRLDELRDCEGVGCR